MLYTVLMFLRKIHAAEPHAIDIPFAEFKFAPFDHPARGDSEVIAGMYSSQ